MVRFSSNKQKTPGSVLPSFDRSSFSTFYALSNRRSVHPRPCPKPCLLGRPSCTLPLASGVWHVVAATCTRERPEQAPSSGLLSIWLISLFGPFQGVFLLVGQFWPFPLFILPQPLPFGLPFIYSPSCDGWGGNGNSRVIDVYSNNFRRRYVYRCLLVYTIVNSIIQV